MAARVLGLAVAGSLMAASASLVAPEAMAKKRGSLSVAGAAFSDDLGDEDCRVAKAAFAMYRADAEATDEDCDLVAGISLPDGADMTSLACTLYDDQAANAIEAHLVRVDLTTGEPDSVFTAPGTVDSSVVQVLRDAEPTPGTRTVDNARYAYYLTAAFSWTDFSTAGSGLRVYGCTVSFE